MADLSGYTPIYVRTTGNNTTGNGSLAAPYATAQKAFNIAIATASGNYVLDFGVGNFGGITLNQNWPSRIAVRGAGYSQSFLGNINGSGADTQWTTDEFGGYYVISDSTPGFNIYIISNNTINLGNIFSNGGNGTSPGIGGNGNTLNAASGGSITLVDCNHGNISNSGGSVESGADTTSVVGNGADISLTNCIGSNCTSNGGSIQFGGCGSGGNITLINSTIANIYTTGGSGNDVIPGGGGNVSLLNSTGASIYTNGGNGPGGLGQIGYNGTISLNNSVAQDTVSYSQEQETSTIGYGSIVLTNNSYVIGLTIGNVTANGFTGTNQYGSFIGGQIIVQIYARSNGNNSTGNGSAGTPYLTAQKAFDVAITGFGPRILNLGSGNFGNISISQDWPYRIAITGLGSGVTTIGDIYAYGTDQVYDFENFATVSLPTKGYNINLSGININTFTINNIISSGGNSINEVAGSGGYINLYNIKANNIISIGGSSTDYNGGNSNYINIYNSICNDIKSVGGFVVNDYCWASNGSSSYIFCSGSTIRDTINSALNHSPIYVCVGNSGGSTTLIDTICRDIYSNGGDGNEQPGDGGNITLNRISFNNIYNNGGSAQLGSSSGGNSMLINSTGNNISSVGYQWTLQISENVSDNKIDGTVNLSGTTIILDTIYSDNIIANGFTGINSSGNFLDGLKQKIIYINSSGNDNTGNGSINQPFATAQKAFQIAMSTGNAALVNFGSGNFGAVSLPNKSLSRYIEFNGVSETSSTISSLNANNGQSITLVANNLSINNIVASGSNVFCSGNYPIPTGIICASGNFINLKRGKSIQRNNLLGLI